MNPYEPPSTDAEEPNAAAVKQPADARRDDKFGLAAMVALLAFGMIQLGFFVIAGIAHVLGGRPALLTVFMGIPLAMVVLWLFNWPKMPDRRTAK